MSLVRSPEINGVDGASCIRKRWDREQQLPVVLKREDEDGGLRQSCRKHYVSIAGLKWPVDSMEVGGLDSRAELIQFLADGVHQGAQGLLAEIEPDPCGCEQFGQGAGSSEGQGASVRGHRLGSIGQALLPDLQGAKLRDAVLDVIERIEEDMQLAVPGVGLGLLVARPIDDPSKRSMSPDHASRRSSRV